MAKSFFAQQGIPYDERDVTQNEQYMQELKDLAGRFITPTLYINGEVVVGFGRNMEQVKRLLRSGGYLK